MGFFDTIKSYFRGIKPNHNRKSVLAAENARKNLPGVWAYYAKESPTKLDWVKFWSDYIRSQKDSESGRKSPHGLPPEAGRVLVKSCATIASRIDDAKDLELEGNKPFLSAVLGSVQSGKTAAMVGLTAHGFNKGYQLVVVLTGTKNDLRTQTARRFQRDLFQTGSRVEMEGELMEPARFTHPWGLGEHGGIENGGEYYTPDKYSQDLSKRNEVVTKLPTQLRKRPCLLVVKKESANLQELKNCINSVDEDISVLVLDDEFDEVSTGASKNVKIPPLMMEIFQLRPTVYIGFTATPQGPLIGDIVNPFGPEEFVYQLSYSDGYHKAKKDKSGLISVNPPDSITYSHSNSHKTKEEWYTGGHVFHSYNKLEGNENFLYEEIDDEGEYPQLEDALIAYFVSGAIRHYMQKGSKFPPQEADTVPANWVLPPSHSMMIHTDSSKDEHANIASWIHHLVHSKAGVDFDIGSVSNNTSSEHFKQWKQTRKLLSEWPDKEGEKWESWLGKYKDSHIAMGGKTWMKFPSWEKLRPKLKEVLENSQLKVINSNYKPSEPRGPITLDFERSSDAEDLTCIPQDIFTICIGGNRLSRGLTIEGLCTTYFSRIPEHKAVDDTMTQRQRWFGYRGPHLQFCRVFTTEEIWEHFKRSNHRDEQLQMELAELFESGVKPKDKEFVMWRDSNSISTRKKKAQAAGPRQLYFQGTNSKPYIDWVQRSVDDQKLAENNLKQAEGLFRTLIDKGGQSFSHPGHKVDTGYLLGDPINDKNGKFKHKFGSRITALEVADFLDSLEFSHHNPPVERAPYQIIVPDILENAIEVEEDIEITDITRQTDGARDQDMEIPELQSPYAIATYLRGWHYYHFNHKTGWEVPPPEFNVFFRHGGKTENPHPIKDESEKKEIGKIRLARKSLNDERGKLTSRWASRQISKTWGGDLNVDDVRSEWEQEVDLVSGKVREPSKSVPRPAGEPGLLFLQILDPESGNDYHDIVPRPVVALRIPDGGELIGY